MQQNCTDMHADIGLQSPRYDRRTRAFRQVRDRIAALVEQAGGPSGLSPVQMQRIERTAQLEVVASEARTRTLRDPSIENLNALTRIENAAQRAFRAAGVAKPKPPGLQQHLATNYPGRASAEGT